MPAYALQIVDDEEHPYAFRWVLLEERPLGGDRFTPLDCSAEAYEVYQEALQAGAQVLAQADGQPCQRDGDLQLHPPGKSRTLPDQ